MTTTLGARSPPTSSRLTMWAMHPYGEITRAPRAVRTWSRVGAPVARVTSTPAASSTTVVGVRRMLKVACGLQVVLGVDLHVGDAVDEAGHLAQHPAGGAAGGAEGTGELQERRPLPQLPPTVATSSAPAGLDASATGGSARPPGVEAPRQDGVRRGCRGSGRRSRAATARAPAPARRRRRRSRLLWSHPTQRGARRKLFHACPGRPDTERGPGRIRGLAWCSSGQVEQVGQRLSLIFFAIVA